MHIQHVLVENIDLQKPSFSIKTPNTYNLHEILQKGAMNFPDRLHKGFQMRSYAEVPFNLSGMTKMATKMKKNTQEILRLCYHQMKKTNKATRVNTRIMKIKIERTSHF